MALFEHAQFDFRGGRNTSNSPDTLDRSEVVNAKNARLEASFGALTKRAGTQRIHDAAIGGGADVLGMVQWDAPGEAGQVVAVANGNLYYLNRGDTDFTEVAGTLSTTTKPSFAVHHTAGTPTLYIGDGAALWSFNGTAISEVTGGSQPDPFRLRVYKTRMFAAVPDSKVLYWSTVEDPEDWSSVAPSNGGQANVEDYSTDGLTAIETAGSSLLLFKADNIARFSGTTPADIQIAQQSDGISEKRGTKASDSVVKFGGRVGFLDPTGFRVASEVGEQHASEKIYQDFQAWDPDEVTGAVSVYHEGRDEVWVFGPSDGQSENDTGYVMDARTGAWTGPWEFSGFNACSMCAYERSDGTESVLVAGYDGRVREGDVEAVGAKDDVLRDDTGGTNIELEIELPTLIGDPTRWKSMRYAQAITADLGAGGRLIATTSAAGPDEGRSCPTLDNPMDSKGEGRITYSFRSSWKGFALRLRLKESTPEIVTIYSAQLRGDYGRRNR